MTPRARAGVAGSEGARRRADDAATGSSGAAAEAFAAGWAMAQLWGPLIHREQRGEVTDHLPTIAELDTATQVSLIVDQLDAHLAALAVTGASVAPLRKVSPEDVAAFQRELHQLHELVLGGLVIAPPALLAGYQLGRALSDTCWIPPDKRDDPSFLLGQFNRHRLAVLRGWLGQMTSDPTVTAATAAVSRSLEIWQVWMATNTGTVERNWNWAWTKAPRARSAVQAALRAQGVSWRDLLAGTVPATTEPGIGAWIVAGESMLRTGRALVGRVLRRFWPAVVMLAAAVGGVLYVISQNSHGASTVASTLVTVGGALGISGVSVRAAARRATSGIEQATWQAALVEARAYAVTSLPTVRQGPIRLIRLHRQGVTAPSSGKRLPGDE